MPRFRLKFLLQEIDLPVGEIIIGRSPQCSITVEDPLVSRKHALIRVTEDEAIFKDLGSKNGSLINGEFVTGEVVLKDGDRIRIGTQEFIFHRIETRERKVKATGFLRYCNYCKIPFPEGAKVCPHCGKPVEESREEPEHRCPRCNLSLSGKEIYCPRCGFKLLIRVIEEEEEKQEKTVRVDLMSITQQNWAYNLLSQSINKALKEQKYSNLKRLINYFKKEIEKNAYFDHKANRNMLSSVLIGSLKMFELTGNEIELEWIFDLYGNKGIIVTEKELNAIIELYSGGKKFNNTLAEYYNKVKEKLKEVTEEEEKRLNLIYTLIET